MKKIFLIIVLLSLSFAVNAQDVANEGKKETGKPIPPEVEALRLAFSLSRYGYENKNPLSLTLAAQIVNKNGFEIEQLNADTLLAQAREFANGNPHLLAIIASADTGPLRGALDGDMPSFDFAKAYSTYEYKVRFKGDKTAVVKVVGVGTTDLDLYIYDSKGNLVVSDTSDSDNCECTWIPKETEDFTVRIKNLDGIFNLYYMQTN